MMGLPNVYIVPFGFDLAYWPLRRFSKKGGKIPRFSKKSGVDSRDFPKMATDGQGPSILDVLDAVGKPINTYK